MPIYDLNFSQLWYDLTPPVLRKSVQVSWGKALLKPLQYQRDMILGNYADGSPYPIYSNASAYTTNDRVVWSGRTVYESISGSTGINPTMVNSWNKILDNYIGVRERCKYNAQKILFEFALNRNFQCSGIYIDNNTTVDDGFIIGLTPDFSTAVSLSDVPSAGGYIGLGYTANTQNNYTIYVPTVVFTGLGTTTLQSENTVRSFADNYNLAGMIYNVLPY